MRSQNTPAVYPVPLIKKLNAFFKPFNDELSKWTENEIELGVNIRKRNSSALQNRAHYDVTPLVSNRKDPI